jgi:DNA-directed RNA polymerase specialized sigma24 family protein
LPRDVIRSPSIQRPGTTITTMTSDSEAFEEHRPALLTLAYRMLGDFGRAEDAVQDAWLRWQRRETVVDAPKAFERVAR